MIENVGVVTRFEHAGQTVVVEDFPPKGDRDADTFVIVHGLGMGRSAYAELAGDLRDHGHVITIDLPGFGEAPEPPRTPTMQQLGDLLAALVAARELSDVTLVGHSMGTQVVSWALTRHPGIAGRAVLVAPTVDASARSVPRQAYRLVIGVGRMNPRTVFRAGREYLRAGPHVLRKTRATVTDSPEHAYPQVHVPALVMRGSHDTVVPDDWARAVHRLLPRAEFELVEGRGHGTILRDTAPIAARIAQFVASAD